MPRWVWTLALVSLVAAPLPAAGRPATPPDRMFEARALDLETGRLLYTERHRIWLKGDRPARETVRYRDPRGKLFAQKTLRYGANPAAPSFRFEDHRTGRIEQARLVKGRWHVAVRENRDDELERDVLDLDGPVLVDEGYRALLRTHRKRLVRGGSISRESIIAARLSSYGMRFAGQGIRARGGRQVLRVKLDMDDFFLRLVGPSAELTLDPASGRVLEFRGLANIRDPSGDLQEARVVYSY